MLLYFSINFDQTSKKILMINLKILYDLFGEAFDSCNFL